MPKPRKKPVRPLTLMEIDRVSLVDKGDNPTAHIMIHKRAEDEDEIDIQTEGEADSLAVETVKGAQMELNQVVEKLTALGETVAKAEQRAARAESIVKLTVDERTHFDKLAAADQDAFLAGDAEFRKQKIEAAKPAPVQKTDVEIRLEKAEQRNTELAERVRKAEDAAELATFVKRASVELPNLPGTDDEKGAMLRAVEKIADPAAREVALKALKAGNAAQESLTKSAGSGRAAAISDSAEAKIEAAASEIMRTEKVSKGQAWVLVPERHPELWAEYREESRKGVN